MNIAYAEVSSLSFKFECLWNPSADHSKIVSEPTFSCAQNLPHNHYKLIFLDWSNILICPWAQRLGIMFHWGRSATLVLNTFMVSLWGNVITYQSHHTCCSIGPWEWRQLNCLGKREKGDWLNIKSLDVLWLVDVPRLTLARCENLWSFSKFLALKKWSPFGAGI